MKRNAQIQPFYNVVKAGTEDKVGEIRIYGYIPDVDWEEYKVKNTVDQFVRDFKALEATCDRINIRINSGGGSLFEGFAMFNAIASSTKDTHTYNDGIAFSLGAILLVAGKTVHAAKNSMTMLHNGSNVVYGNAKDMREMADTLDAFDLQICEMFADKTGKSLEEIRDITMNYKDNYFTAKRAKEFGLVDIIEDYAADVPENISAMSQAEIVNHLKGMQDAEDSLFGRIMERVRNSFGNLLPGNKIQFQEEKMDLIKLNEALNAADEKGLVLTAAQVADLKNEVLAAKDVVAKADHDQVVEDLRVAEQDLAEVRNAFEAFKKGDGGSVTVPKAGVDAFGDKGESVQDILDALPHNKAIADNPLFN